MTQNLCKSAKSVDNRPSLITYPARPVNGGRLESAPPKVGPWICQPKIDDWRAIVHTPTKRIWNRHGEPMSITADLVNALLVLTGFPFEWLDVGVIERRSKILRRSLIVFDWIPVFGPDDAPGGLYQDRRAALARNFTVLLNAAVIATVLADRHRTDSVWLVPEHPIDQTQSLYADYQRQNDFLMSEKSPIRLNQPFYEGIVCKRTDKPYPVQLLSPTKETPWMIKHRFDQ